MMRGLLSLTLLLLVAGCATVQPPQRSGQAANDSRLEQCIAWYDSLDKVVADAGVADVAARRVKGFPYLRIDRFLVAMKPAAIEDERTREAWVEAMRALDEEGRRVEIENLPQNRVAELGAGDRESTHARTQACAELLMAADLSDDSSFELLYRYAFVADDYSTAKRGFGLYELTRLPFYSGVRGWQEDVVATFEQAGRGDLESLPGVLYRPPPGEVYSREEVAELLASSADHPLGVSRLSSVQRNRLFATYAPVFEIETDGDYDRIGRIYWPPSGAARVDIANPVVYRRLGYTLLQGLTLLQLEYHVWMPERPKQGGTDLLGGHLDGLVWRITLAPDGEPILADSIHPCGCYHMFFPSPRLEPLPAPEKGVEWAFSPADLPRVEELERIVLGLQTRTHYLSHVSAATVTSGSTYAFADYDELRTLPLPGTGTRSLFGPDALVAGTERGERFLFWPMGIASPGAMRQSGSQPTAFVGRRHFDDADLVDKRYKVVEKPL